jgi:pilus assembly protein CpaC
VPSRRHAVGRFGAAMVLVALPLIAARPAAAKSAREEITLTVGEQTTIPAKDVQSYSEGAPGIIDVRLPKDGPEFVIVALKPGTTSLLLLFEDGTKAQYTFRVSGLRGTDGAVSKKENIRLDFYFVEMAETYSHQIGMGWPSNIGGGGVFRANAAIDLKASNVLSATAIVANQPLPRLDLLQSSGFVKISRQAVLVTANGNEAKFSSGGELNFSVQGGLAAEIRQIEFGSLIRVLPRYDEDSGRIELTVAADVSDLTDDRGSGLPGRTVSKLETLVNLELGQGVMLAGLNSHTETGGRTGLPLLSQIPVFGYLFGTRGNREEQIQNVLFIVPTVVDVVESDARARITEALGVFEQFDGDIAGIDLPGKPGAGGTKSGGRRKGRAPR